MAPAHARAATQAPPAGAPSRRLHAGALPAHAPGGRVAQPRRIEMVLETSLRLLEDRAYTDVRAFIARRVREHLVPRRGRTGHIVALHVRQVEGLCRRWNAFSVERV